MKCLVSAKGMLRRGGGEGSVHTTRTVGDIAPKVPADDDVPGGTVALVKLLLDLCGDVLLYVVLFEGARGDVDALLLHLLAHVDVFDDRLGADAAGCTADARVSGV